MCHAQPGVKTKIVVQDILRGFQHCIRIRIHTCLRGPCHLMLTLTIWRSTSRCDCFNLLFQSWIWSFLSPFELQFVIIKSILPLANKNCRELCCDCKKICSFFTVQFDIFMEFISLFNISELLALCFFVWNAGSFCVLNLLFSLVYTKKNYVSCSLVLIAIFCQDSVSMRLNIMQLYSVTPKPGTNTESAGSMSMLSNLVLFDLPFSCYVPILRG